MAKDEEVHRLLLRMREQIIGSMKAWGSKKEKPLHKKRIVNKGETSCKVMQKESTLCGTQSKEKPTQSITAQERSGGGNGAGSKRKGRRQGNFL